MAKIITLISAQPDLGKTHVGVYLSHRLAARGLRTCLFNADPDSRAICRLLGVKPRSSLSDLIDNRYAMDRIICQTPVGIDFFPGTPGLEQISGLESEPRARLMRSFMELNDYDFFVLDTFPGLSRHVVALSKASSAVVLIMTPETKALTDAYLLLKALSINGFDGSVMVIINKSKNVKIARAAYLKFKEAVETYQTMTIQPLGSIFLDPHVEQAEKAGKPFLSLHPETDAAKCVDNIVRHIMDRRIGDVAVSAFWTDYAKEIKKPFRLPLEKPMPSSKPPFQNDESEDGFHPEMMGIDPISSLQLTNAEEAEGHTEIGTRLDRMQEQIDILKQNVEAIQHVGQTAEEPVSSPETTPSFDISKPDEEVQIALDFDAYLKQRSSRR